MTPKERILAAINHEQVDRIPCDYWGVPEITEKLKDHFDISSAQNDQGKVLASEAPASDGKKDDMELWQKLGVDKIIHLPVAPTYRTSLKSKFFKGPSFPEDQDIWGNIYTKYDYMSGEGTYMEVSKDGHPLSQWNTISEVENNYTFPKVGWFDFSELERDARKYSKYALEGGYMAPFYMYNNLRGVGKSLKDLVSNKDYAHHIIGKICDFLYNYQKKILKAAGEHIDIVEVTDDFGTQNRAMISPESFDDFFKPCYQRLIQLVKDYEIKVFHHDDGAIRKIIPKMVDLGIDILNPIQWRLPGMDPEELKLAFGGDICFHGGVDNQETLPYGKPSDVKEEVKMLLDTLGSNGTGYILAPCHNFQLNTPIENIIAMYGVSRTC